MHHRDLLALQGDAQDHDETVIVMTAQATAQLTIFHQNLLTLSLLITS
jgi:hypothetical protein